MKRTLFIFIFTLMLGSTIYSQSGGQISGLVMSNDYPVAGATVSIKAKNGKTFSAVTDAEGRYTFTGLDAGDYEITGIYNGVTNRVVQLADGQQLTVDLDLVLDRRRMSPAMLREFVTISANTAQTIDEVSKTVSVIDGQEMRDRADITLVDSLRSIPGFRVQQLGGFGRTASIKTRGLRNQDTAILIDGVRFRDAAAITGDASSFLSDITLTSVSKVEVLRGSGSSLYGTNAIGGTVNFITPSAPSGWHGQISGAFGGLGFGRFRGNTSYGTDNGKFGFNLGVSRTAFTKGIDGNDNASNTNLQPSIYFRPTNNTVISARFFFSDAKVRLNASPDTFGTMPASNSTIIDAQEDVNFISDVDDPDSIQRSRAFNGVLSVTHSFTNDIFVSGYYSALDTKRRNDNGLLGPGWQSETTTHNDGLIQTASVSAGFRPKNHEIKVGYEFEHERYSNENLTPSGTENNSVRAFQQSNTFFAQDVVSLFDGRLQLAGGARAQWFDLKMPQFSLANSLFTNVTAFDPDPAYTFDGAASYFIRESGTKLRVHAGNGYRVPSLYERFGSYFTTFPAPGFVALGDPGLMPEKTTAFDAGVEQNMFGNKARLSAVYFYTELNDIIGYGNVAQPDPNGRFAGYLNTKGGLARGGEFSIDAKPTSTTDIFASYTYTNSDQRQPQVAGSGIIQTLGISKNQFTLVATQRFRDLWVNVDLLISDSYLAPIFSNSTFGTYLYRFEGNRRADLTAGYTFKFDQERYKLRLHGTIENLFDNEYFENGFKTVGINGRAGLAFSW